MSLETKQKISLDFIIPRIQNVRCVENDENSRIVEITVTENGKFHPISSTTMVARYKIRKPDNTYIYNTAKINEDGTVTIDLTEQAMLSPGIACSELQISDSSTGQILSTMPFRMIVEKSVVSNQDMESSNESDVISGMIHHLADYENPHKTTKSQVGLGNVPNVTTNDQTPTYEEANTLTKLTSGEKLSTAFGKISKAVSSLISHISTIATSSVLGHVKVSAGNGLKNNSGVISLDTANESNFGTAKISDVYDSKMNPGDAANGICASQNALYQAYNDLNKNKADNSFSNIIVGSSTIAADSPTDTLTLVAGANITLTPDINNDKLTISSTDTNTHYTSKNVINHSSIDTSDTATALTGGYIFLNSVENGSVTSSHKISGSGATTVNTDASGNIIISSTDNNTVYTHPTTSGNKHIPSGGSSGQILRWSADGTAAWGTDNNTTYSAGTGISLSGTTFSNSGVRSISTGSSNGTISVNTNGTSTDVTVKGLGSAAYTASNTYAAASHTHNYAASSSAGGAASSANKLNTNAGSSTQPVYFSNGVPVSCSYTLEKSVPGNAVFTDTNTWRGIQNNLTSTSTSDSLSAYQGYLLANGNARDSTKIPLSGSSAITGSLIPNNTTSSLGNGTSNQWNMIYAKNFYENGTALSSKYVAQTSYYTTITRPYINVIEIKGTGTNYCTGGLHIASYSTANGSIASTYGEVTGTSDNTCNLGQYHTRWMNIYAATGAVSTSDRNYKDNIKNLSEDDRYFELFVNLIPVSFTFKDGTSGRTHVGFIAQDVEDTMNKIGLSPLEFAGFCKDTMTEECIDENGNTTRVSKLNENGEPIYIYSLRYEEFIAIIVMVLQQIYSSQLSFVKRLSDLERKTE